MRKQSIISFVLAAVLLAMFMPVTAKADSWDKKTVVTFDQDVQIPGQVLPAGTYVFKLFSSSSDRFIVQVWTEHESELLATLITVGDANRNSSDNSYFVLDMTDTDEGYPPVLSSWFFAGSDEGRDFIYSGYSTARLVNDATTPTQPDQPQ